MGIPQANKYLINQNDWKNLLKEAGLGLNYFDEWNAKSFDQKPGFQESIIRLKDKVIQKISTLKKENRKEAKALRGLPENLFIENKAYLNSYIMIAKKN